MPDFAVLVEALYAEHKRWERVAEVCANGKSYPASYYWRIAKGEIEHPGAKARRGIIAAVKSLPACVLTELSVPTERAHRFGLTVRHSLGVAVSVWRKSQNLTWNEWMEQADRLMREHYESCKQEET